MQRLSWQKCCIFHSAGFFDVDARGLVTRMQCRSLGSPPDIPDDPRTFSNLLMLLTRKMLILFSQQNAWISVKWICRATSLASSPSVARTHSTTLSGSTFSDFAASYTPMVMQPWHKANDNTSSSAFDTESILWTDKCSPFSSSKVML